jgi:hypothetical protein
LTASLRSKQAPLHMRCIDGCAVRLKSESLSERREGDRVCCRERNE